MTANINTPPNDRDLDRLNDLWDTLATGHRAPVRPRPDPAQSETIRALSGTDDTPNPDPRFLRDLRSSLMDTTLDAAPRGLPNLNLSPLPKIGPVTPAHPLIPPRPGLLRRLSGASMRAMEIAAVAALLLAMIGFAAGNDGLNSLRALLPASQDNPAAPTGDATMYLGNAAHTGEMPGPGPDGDVGLLWRIPDATRAWTPDSSPVAAGGILYLTTRTTNPETGRIETSLSALDLATGTTLWEAPLPGFQYDGVNGGPVVAGGFVYVAVSLERWLGGPPATPEAGATPEGASPASPEPVAHMAGEVIALDAQTGDVVWSYDNLPRAGDHSPVVADGTLYVVTEDGTLHALDALTGEPRWTASVPDDPLIGFDASPTVADGTVYISSPGQLHALDGEDGAERWTAPISENVPTVAVVADDTVFVGTFSDTFYDLAGTTTVGVESSPEATPAPPTGGPHIFAFDTATGAERWAFDPGGRLGGAPTVAGDTLLLTGVGESGHDIVALATADGTERWRTPTADRIITPAVWSGDTVYAGSFDSNLYALDLATGAINWQVATGGGISSAAFVAGGVVTFSSYDGTLYAVSSVAPGAATPSAAGAPTNDISGLPPCTITPRPELEQSSDGMFLGPEGTPTTTSVRPDYDPDEVPSSQNLLFADVPTGDPAPQTVTGAIQSTLEAMTACDRPGYENHLAAYFSDDYFRRNPVSASFSFYGYGFLSVPGANTGHPGTEPIPFESATVLPDGRVATVLRYTHLTSDPADTDGFVDAGWLYVWVESDGRWLIDEWVELSETPVLG